jgi:formiminoglutamase
MAPPLPRLDDLPLAAADPALFFSRGDADDPRLGERVGRQPEQFAQAGVVIVGCPQDEGVRRNGGRPGAARAPAEIRRALYRLTTNGLDGLALFDAGDTQVQPDLEATHAAHLSVVRRLLDAGKRVIALGGGNDVSYPDCAALAQHSGDIVAFNIDAHFDVRADVPRNSGTPYRQLLDEGLLKPARFHEVGALPWVNAAAHARWLAEKSVRVLSLEHLRRKGIERALRRCLREAQAAKAVFWGFDADVVRASDAPGVSAPNPLGMTGEEFCAIARLAGAEPRTRIVEFTEVNPAFDVDGRTSRLVAAAIHQYLSELGRCSRK